MDNRSLKLSIKRIAKSLISDEVTDTFECPECGGDVLSNTEYCVSCKDKVKEAAKAGRLARIRSSRRS